MARKKPKKLTVSVDIDLSVTAYANARMQYDTKKSSATKEKKTIEASGMALANAEKKTATALKGLAVNATMQKARKTYSYLREHPAPATHIRTSLRWVTEG